MQTEQFKIGSKVYIKTRWQDRIETIERETNTMWFTQNDRTRFYKKDNTVVGDKLTKVVLAKKEHFDFIEKGNLTYKIRNFDFSELSLEKLREIEKIIFQEGS